MPEPVSEGDFIICLHVWKGSAYIHESVHSQDIVDKVEHGEILEVVGEPLKVHDHTMVPIERGAVMLDFFELLPFYGRSMKAVAKNICEGALLICVHDDEEPASIFSSFNSKAVIGEVEHLVISEVRGKAREVDGQMMAPIMPDGVVLLDFFEILKGGLPPLDESSEDESSEDEVSDDSDDNKISDGVFLTCIDNSDGEAEVFESVDSQVLIGTVECGDMVEAAGAPIEVDGYMMVPIKPIGAVQVDLFEVEKTTKAPSNSSLRETAEPEEEAAGLASGRTPNDLHGTAFQDYGNSYGAAGMQGLFTMSPAQVGQHFAAKGYKDLAPLFSFHNISGDRLLFLNSDDLRDMGVTKVGDRMGIQQELSALKSVARTGTPMIMVGQAAQVAQSTMWTQYSAQAQSAMGTQYSAQAQSAMGTQYSAQAQSAMGTQYSAQAQSAMGTQYSAQAQSAMGTQYSAQGAAAVGEAALAPKDSSKVSLTITIVKAAGLRGADSMLQGGKSDPFCTCQIKGRSEVAFTTTTVKKTRDPTWNHEEVLHDVGFTDSLEFKVYDWDMGKSNDALGHVTVEPSQFFPQGFAGELELVDAGKGQRATLTIKIEVKAKRQAETRAEAEASEEAKAKREAKARAEAEAQASTKIEAFWRGKAAREEAKAKRQAKARAEAVWRGKAAREEVKGKREAKAKAEAEAQASTKIEAFWRGKAAREEAKAKRQAKAKADAEAQASTKIEAFWRGKAAREEAKAKRQAKVKAEAEAKAQASTKIEAFWRGKAAREEAKAKRQAKAKAEAEAQASTKIEAFWRGKAAREEAKAKRQAKARAEAVWRGKAAREEVKAKRKDKEARVIAESREKAATRIQSVQRGKVARAEVKAKREARAATKIQARYRGNVGRSEVKAKIEHEKELRRQKKAQERAAVEARLQKMEAAKRRKEEEENSEKHRSAARIQAQYRGNKARQEVANKRVNNARMQRKEQLKKERDQVEHKLKMMEHKGYLKSEERREVFGPTMSEREAIRHRRIEERESLRHQRELAATRIQSQYRGNRDRQFMREYHEEVEARRHARVQFHSPGASKQQRNHSAPAQASSRSRPIRQTSRPRPIRDKGQGSPTTPGQGRQTGQLANTRGRISPRPVSTAPAQGRQGPVPSVSRTAAGGLAGAGSCFGAFDPSSTHIRRGAKQAGSGLIRQGAEREQKEGAIAGYRYARVREEWQTRRLEIIEGIKQKEFTEHYLSPRAALVNPVKDTSQTGSKATGHYIPANQGSSSVGNLRAAKLQARGFNMREEALLRARGRFDGGQELISP